MFDTPELTRGSSKIIVASRYWGERYPTLEFLREHATQEEQIKLLRLLDMAANNWPIRNREKSKHIEGELWEFKSFQLRLPYVLRPGNLVVVTHAFRKKRHDIPKEEIIRALDIVKYFDRHYDFATGTYRREQR